MSEPVDVFVSYAREDRELARQIAQWLESRGLQIWWDISIRAGQDFEALIRRALGRVKCVLVLWTSASVESVWVREEAKRGLTRGVLVPALFVSPDHLPLPFGALHGVDLRGWSGGPGEPEIDQLLAEVERLARSTIIPPDSLMPSVEGLKRDVAESLEANKQIGALVDEMWRTVPTLRHGDAQTLAQLDSVLDEVHATVRAVNEAVEHFLKPALSAEPIDRNPGPYLELASRDLLAVIEEGRGHCQDIGNIYFGPEGLTWQRFQPLPVPPDRPPNLRYWVHNHLDAADASRLDRIFLDLDNADWDLFARLGQVGETLSETARSVVRLLAHARPRDALTLVVNSIDIIQPLQRALSDRMQEIRKLQARVRQF